MLDYLKCICGSDLQKIHTNLSIKSWADEAKQLGTILANSWLQEKAAVIDLWGVDSWGEEFVNAFLQRILDVDLDIDEAFEDVNNITWYYNSETFNFGFPFQFENAIWIKNFLSKDKIKLPDLPSSIFTLSSLDINYTNCLELLKEIKIKNHEITNARYIENKIYFMLYPMKNFTRSLDAEWMEV